MVFLSPRFTILAVFCSLAAISLPPRPASAIAIQARHSTSVSKNPVLGNSSRQQTPVLSLPLNGIKSAAKKNKDKETHLSNGKQHKAVRASLRLADLAFGKSKRHQNQLGLVDVELPSTEIRILKRYDSHDQAYFHDGSTMVDSHSAHAARHHHHEHDEIIVKGKDAHVHVHRRSSVIVPGENGKSYVVSSTPRAPAFQRSVGSTDGQAHFDSESDKDGVPGRVDVMSAVADGGQPKKIASLVLEKDMTLRAAQTDPTEIRLVNAQGAMASSESGTRLVKLTMMVYNASSSVVAPYCATTNVQGGSSAMTAEHCDDSPVVDPAKNQFFDYNIETGIIRPTQLAGHDDGMKDDVSNSSGAAPSNAASVSSFDERDADGPNNAQPVELLFVSNAPKISNVEDLHVTVVTATSTITSTFTFTTSMTASVSAADVTVTSTISSSVSTVPSAFASSSVSAEDASPTLAMVSSSLTGSGSSSIESTTAIASAAGASDTLATVSSSSTAVASSVTSAPTSLAALDVQVVTPANSSSDAVSTTVTRTSTSTTPTSSIDAEAIASRIAASFDSSADIVSSTVTPTATAAAMDASSSAASSMVSSSMPSMTPVSTAPYMLMFKVGKE